MVPYDLLTDKEKRKDRERTQELLKYLQFMGYKLHRSDEMKYQTRFCDLNPSTILASPSC